VSLEELLEVILIAASPIAELRLAIPLAINTFNFPWYYALLLAIIGNLLPVPFILLFLDAATRLLSRVALFKRMLDWLFERTRRRGRIIERYKRIGLVLFVAIPLPVTGAWTGSLAAVLFGIGLKQAFFSILLGVLIAGVIVTCLTLLGWAGAVIAGIALCSLAVYGLLKSHSKQGEC
jgi:uncharacterized membrane protein